VDDMHAKGLNCVSVNSLIFMCSTVDVNELYQLQEATSRGRKACMKVFNA